SALGHAAVVALVIWAFYGFRFAAFNPALPPADHFIRPWADYVGNTGLIGEATRELARLKALPEGYLYGFDYVLATTKSRAAFLNGEHSITGWRTFFIWTFLLKTTLPILIATLLLTFGVIRRACFEGGGRRIFYRWTPLVALLTIYGATSITSQLNIGHRHILPLYPVIFIAAGGLGTVLFSANRWRMPAMAALCTWQAFEGWRIAPYHLAYFNPIAGGPANGWRHLVDSSLDWGQDLPALKQWLESNAKGQPAYLSYFGTAEPAYYKISARRLVFVNNFRFAPIFEKLEPGVYCISATILQQVYTPVGGPWTPEREKEYQELRALEPAFTAYSTDSGARTELLKNVPAERWQNAIQRHDVLRMARLTAFLRPRKPDANAGYSILIYRLSAEEIHDATAGTWSEWLRRIERTAAPDQR
ncbi:MAG: hypothetical protein WCQ89_15650, partial [Verrucomicrobiota bacterium]